jgi:hypothetical protein
MTDDVRGKPSNHDGAATRARRRYIRPVLLAFGTVNELTRGASGKCADIGKRRKGECPQQ